MCGDLCIFFRRKHADPATRCCIADAVFQELIPSRVEAHTKPRDAIPDLGPYLRIMFSDPTREHQQNLCGFVHGPAPDGSKEGWSAGTPPALFIADKIRTTISRGCGSIETMIGFSSGPGSSSVSNWLCSKFRGMKCSCRTAMRRAI